MIIKPFSPKWGSNLVVTPAAGAAISPIDPDSATIRVLNSGVNKGYFRTYNSKNFAPSLVNGVVGPAAPVATVADYPVVPSMASTVGKALGDDTISYISALGTTFEIMSGDNGV